MANSGKKRLKIVLVCIAALFLLIFGFYFASAGYFSSTGAPSTDIRSHPSDFTASSQLVITNLNIGKADCAVLQCNEIVGIIDTGTYESYNTLTGFLQKNSISEIDFLILTHYDQDHIGGAINLLEDYRCDSIYLADYVSDKKYYSALMDLVSNLANVNFVSKEQTISYGPLSLIILPADEPVSLLENENNRDNNMSLVTMISFVNKQFLFTGDIEKDRIAQMLSFNDNLEADWIKMPHHGEYQKKVAQLLEAVMPEYAVISTSNEKPVEEKLIDLLKEDNIKIYDTTESDVITICDGNNITVSTE